MFQITKDPSSESIVQYLAKITRMVLSCPLIWMWLVLWQHILTYCVCVCTVHCIGGAFLSVELLCPLTWMWSVLWQHILTHCVCVCVYSSRYRKCHLIYWTVHTHQVTICCHDNEHNRNILVILGKYCTVLPNDGSFVIQNMLEHF